jgi:two-component system, LuxR family, sensor kinase FixL
LGQIVTSLKDYSKPAMVSFGKVRLREVVRSVAEGQGDVVLEECAENPVISGDATRLKEALRNLVTNSREALAVVPSEERKPIEVGLRVDGKWAMIEVRDEAGGFSDMIRNSIGLEWNSTKGKGRGMGLPIVKRVVEGHGGELRVDSTRTRGSSILMKLPIYQEEGGASNAETTTG